MKEISLNVQSFDLNTISSNISDNPFSYSLIRTNKWYVLNEFRKTKTCQYLYNELCKLKNSINELFNKEEFNINRKAKVLIYNTFSRFYKSHLVICQNIQDEQKINKSYNQYYYTLLKDYLTQFNLLDQRVPNLGLEMLTDIKYSKSLDIIEIPKELVKYYYDVNLIINNELLVVNNIKIYNDESDFNFLYHDTIRDYWFKIVGTIFIIEDIVIDDGDIPF